MTGASGVGPGLLLLLALSLGGWVRARSSSSRLVQFGELSKSAKRVRRL